MQDFNLIVLEDLTGTSEYADKIVWYFPELETLTTTVLYGSVFAPTTDLTIGAAEINGSVVADNVELNGEVHLPYASWDSQNTVPEPATVLLLGLGILSLVLQVA